MSTEPEWTLAQALELAACEGRIALAGDRAARRALKGSESGWVRRRTSGELKAFHECGHSIVAMAAGRYVFALSIEIQAAKIGKQMWGGFALVGRNPEPSAEAPAAPEETDKRHAVKLAFVMDARPTWKTMRGHIRRWQAEADALIEKRWPIITKLAGELERRHVLNRAEIEAILGPNRRQLREAQPA